jgi:hypothetical protein
MFARSLCLLILVAFSAPVRSSAAAFIHHDLQVDMKPHAQRFEATDTVTLPADRPETMVFRLHAGLAPHSPTPRIDIVPLTADGSLHTYRVRLPDGQNQFVLTYGGRIHHALQDPTHHYARGIPQTMGQISREGVYLSGASGWYPQFATEFLTFALHVQLPDGWQAVSQGTPAPASPASASWRCEVPQDEIYLIAGRFTLYQRKSGRVQAMVFLRQAEPALAEAYLDATARYIAMYDRLIGPYPYAKFALVENFWETGFGMPSFTLLGPRVIRFPFILHASYPHEILHNWWGNSVYPRYAAGNWAEGLTAYLADHLLQEQRGQAAGHRQTVLQKYTDYVSEEKDFPLVEFTGRHSSATEAVGYGKTMMFFHMLRRQLGDAAFIEALQRFYQRHRFQTADFTDLQRSFEAVAEVRLENDFTQWVTRTGAPQLGIEKVRVREKDGHFELDATLRQRQVGASYALRVPIAVTLDGEPAARVEIVRMRDKEQSLTLVFERRPLRIDVDPRFDLFRKLDPAELPPALSRLYGAREILAVLPAAASNADLAAYRAFVRSMGRAGPEKMVQVLDRDLERLPADKNVLLLGWANRFRDVAAAALAPYKATLAADQVTLNGTKIARQKHAIVLTARQPDRSDEKIVAWIAADPREALAGLARKLPHYHKYSYLAFAGSAPDNIAKGRWPVLASPMTVYLGDDRPAAGLLPEEKPLASLPPASSAR